MSLLHVTFCESAAGSLAKALAAAGRAERVIALIDDLGAGPLGPPMTGARRCAWALSSALEDDEVVARIDAFWAEVVRPEVSVIAWTSHRSVRDLTAFLALASQREGDLRFVDVAEVPFTGRDGQPGPRTGMTFGFVRDDQILAHGLLDRAEPLAPAVAAGHRATWARLEREDADLRILDETGLASAPLTHFDAVILAGVTTVWQRCARVVGDAWHAASSGRYLQVGDSFIWYRLRELIDQGALEADGDLASMHTSRVRRAA